MFSLKILFLKFGKKFDQADAVFPAIGDHEIERLVAVARQLIRRKEVVICLSKAVIISPSSLITRI